MYHIFRNSTSLLQ